MATKKKKEGMLGKAIRGLNKTNVATGTKPIKVRQTAPVQKPAKRVNRNKPAPTITTSAAKAAAQKKAIQRRVDAQIKAKKNRKG